MRKERFRALALAIGLCTVLMLPVLVVSNPITNTWTVIPFDWSSLEGQSYDWYDLEELNIWILDGGIKPASTLMSVVNLDGTPNLPEAPDSVPAEFSKGYSYNYLYFDVATQVFAYADMYARGYAEYPLGFELDPESVTFYQELEEIADNAVAYGVVGMEEPDKQLLMGYWDRYIRRQEVMTELKSTIETNFAHDSNNMQMAFDAASSIPGAIVQLVPGTFYAARMVVAYGFDGHFMGSGQEATVIKTVPGGFLKYSSLFAEPTEEQRLFDTRSALFVFSEGNIHVSDMAIICRGRGEYGAHGYVTSMWEGFYITGRTTGVDDREISAVSSSIENVDIVGEAESAFPDFLGGYGMLSTIFIIGEQIIEVDRFGGNFFKCGKEIVGNHIIENSYCVYSLNGPSTGGVKDSSVVITGNIIERCDAAIGFSDNSNTRFEITNNDLLDSNYGLWVAQAWIAMLGVDFAPGGSTYLSDVCDYFVYNNRITGTRLGILAYDFAPSEDTKSLGLHVKHNEFASSGFSPIVTRGVIDGVFEDNYVTGSYVYGVNPYYWSNGWTIEGNTFGKTMTGDVLGVTSIYGAISIEMSNDCTVTNNTFFDVAGFLGAVWVYGDYNTIVCNDYTQSGLFGWTADGWTTTGCIFLDWGTGNNIVLEHLFPEGTTAFSQIRDWGDNVKSLSNLMTNLLDLVDKMNLKQGIDSSLDAKIQNVQDALDAANAGNRQDAINKLGAFISAVEAQRGKALTDEQASILVEEALRIIKVLEILCDEYYL